MKDLKLKNIINYNNRDFLVSTITTPIRHIWFENDEKIIYETMIFEIKNEEIDYENPLFNERYQTYDEAVAEHSFLIKNPKLFVK